MYTNVNASAFSAAPAPTCGGEPAADVWFTVSVPPDGQLDLITQPGEMTDAAMAIYRVASGSCTEDDLVLEQIDGACATGTISPVPGMPSLSVTGQEPGATLYVRVWRQTGNDGTFAICAGRVDDPPGNCFYTLTMHDSGGDGWDGSFVTICIAGNCTNYSVVGSHSTISFGVNVGQTLVVSYTVNGGSDQGQNSYTITQYGLPIYVSGTQPAAGQVYLTTVSCDPPPAPPTDCIGAMNICSMGPVPPHPISNYQLMEDLNSNNQGCLEEGEHEGFWYAFQSGLDAGNLALQVVPLDITNTTIIDIALWGPYLHPFLATPDDLVWNGLQSCPPQLPPIRCSYAEVPGAKGLAYDDGLATTEGSAGTGQLRHLSIEIGEYFLLYVDRRSGPAGGFTITFTEPPAAYQPMAGLSCQPFNPPPTIIDHPEGPQMVMVAPNPSNGQFTVVNGFQAGDMELQVIDLGGRTLHRQIANVQAHEGLLVDVSDVVASGSYLLHIRIDDRSVVHKLVIQ